MSGDPSLQPHTTHEKPPRRCDRQYIIRLGYLSWLRPRDVLHQQWGRCGFDQEFGPRLCPLGIRVNAVCPHEIITPRIRSGFERRGPDPHKAVQELNKNVPLGRIAESEDIADVIAFLASDEAKYIAGETVEVTGVKPVSG